jgi:hypothetical protein
MTQKDKIIRAGIFAHKMKSIARSIEAEGNNYDMQWHKNYCRQLIDVSNEFLKILK